VTNRGRRTGYRARTGPEQDALERERVAFTRAAISRGCELCVKIRARCPVCAGVY